MIFAVFGSNYQSCHLADIERLLNELAARGAEYIFVEPEFYLYLLEVGVVMPRMACVAPERISAVEAADMVISLGGDGTFLHTARLVAPAEKPVLGINTGNLGYLAASPIVDPVGIAANIFAGRYNIEERSMLRATVTGQEVCALNEVVVHRRDTASLVDVEAWVNGKVLATYRADGLIVSTPTGSTAYNLSVGGPIAAPDTPVWIMAPICAHTLSIRPIVIPDTSQLLLRVRSRAESFLVNYDGVSLEVPSGSEIAVSKAPYCTRIVMGEHRDFVDTLREKLHWDFRG